MSAQAAPAAAAQAAGRGTVPRQDGDTVVPVPHPGSAIHAWGIPEHPAVPYTWGTPSPPWGMLPLHMGHPRKAPPGLPPSTQGTLSSSPPAQGTAVPALILPRASPSVQGTQESPPRAAPLPQGGLLPSTPGPQFCSPLGLSLSIWGGCQSPPHCHGGCRRQGAPGRLPWGDPHPRKAPSGPPIFREASLQAGHPGSPLIPRTHPPPQKVAHKADPPHSGYPKKAPLAPFLPQDTPKRNAGPILHPRKAPLGPPISTQGTPARVPRSPLPSRASPGLNPTPESCPRG